MILVVARLIEAAIMDDIWYKLEYEQKKESMFCFRRRMAFLFVFSMESLFHVLGFRGSICTCMRVWYYFYFGNSQDNNWGI